MQREAHFCAVAWACLPSVACLSWSVTELLGPRYPTLFSGARTRLYSVVRWHGRQLSCTCQWLAASQGQILLSISTVRKTLQSVRLGLAGSSILDAMKHAVTDLVSYHL